VAGSGNSGYITGLQARLLEQPGLVPFTALEVVNGPRTDVTDTTTYDYTDFGFVSSVTNALGHVTEITSHDGAGRPLTIEDANGVETELAYDDRGRLTTVTVDPGTYETVTGIEYDDVGQVTEITLPDGASLAYAYDDARRLTSITDGDGEKITYAYDAMGNVTEREIETAGSTVVFTQTRTYDELGRLLTSIGADSQTTSFAYNKVDNLVEITDPRSNSYSFAFDALNRLIQETDEGSGVIDLTLDDNGEVVDYEDPRDLGTAYVRNGWGEAIRRDSPDTGLTDYVRNEAGLVTRMTDARGVVTNYTWDAIGRLLTRTYPSSTGENVGFTYDSTAGGNNGKGRLTSVSDEAGSIALAWDIRGNLVLDTRVIDGESYATEYDYDEANRLALVVYPSGRILNYWRDAQGRITSVTTREDAQVSQEALASNIAYMPMSTLIQALDYGNGLDLLNTYTDDYEIDQLGVYDGLTDIIQRVHARADDLNLTGITDNVATANSQTFAYTDTNRLETAGGPWGDLTFAYDATGNRTERVLDDGQTTQTKVFGYPSTSNLIEDEVTDTVTTRGFTHDDAGNMIRDTRGSTDFDYTINHAGRIAEVEIDEVSAGAYTYNGFSQLAIRSESVAGGPGGPIHYIHDRDGRLLAEADGTSGDILREYIWLNGAPLAVVDDVDTQSPLIYFVHNDHLARPVMMTDASKTSVWEATWLPWGEVII